MAQASTARVLQENLTERGLVRILASQDVAPQIVRQYSLEEAARHLQRGLRRSSPMVRTAKKAKKSAKSSAKKNGHRRNAKVKSLDKPVAGTSAARLMGSVQPQPNYWARVKRELRTIICTDDPKYKSLRQSLGKSGMSQATMTGLITGAMIPWVGGPTAAVIGLFVTLGLLGFLQVGTNAWCSA